MFCADYIASFVFHGLISVGFLEGSCNGYFGSKFTPERTNNMLSPHGQSFLIGSLAGLFGASAVFPFDFVRRGVIQGKVKLRHGMSTVPYAGVFFGLYFSCRNSNSTSSQFGWAFASAFGAALAEIPFDKAKLAMLGSRRTMVFVSGLYVPFGALMLVMYDKALLRLKHTRYNITIES